MELYRFACFELWLTKKKRKQDGALSLPLPSPTTSSAYKKPTAIPVTVHLTNLKSANLILIVVIVRIPLLVVLLFCCLPASLADSLQASFYKILYQAELLVFEAQLATNQSSLLSAFTLCRSGTWTRSKRC